MQNAQNQLASDYINLQIVNIYVIHISIARVCTLHRGCIAYTLWANTVEAIQGGNQSNSCHFPILKILLMESCTRKLV